MFCRLPRHVVSPCVCVFITGGPIKKQCAGEGGGMENMCQRTRLAAACADESRHLTRTVLRAWIFVVFTWFSRASHSSAHAPRVT